MLGVGPYSQSEGRYFRLGSNSQGHGETGIMAQAEGSSIFRGVGQRHAFLYLMAWWLYFISEACMSKDP